MATQTDAEKKAAEAAAKKTVPKEMRERLLRGQETPVETPEAKTAREAAEKAAADKVTADAKAKADADANEAEEKKRKKEKVDLPPIPAAGAPAPLTEAAVKKIVDDAKTAPAATTTTTLAPEDRTDLELAEFAAREHGDRYTDLPKRVAEWFPKRDGHLEAKAKELGGRESAEFRDYVNGEDYRKFVRDNAPTYQRGDAKKIYEEFIEDRGARRAVSKLKPEMDDLRKRQLQIEQQPIIEQTVGQGVQVMLKDDDATPDEAFVEFSKNPAGFLQSNEIEGQIIVRHATFFKDAMAETLRVTSGLVDVQQIEKNPTPTQKWIDSFIQQKEREIEAKYPNGASSAGGAIIVSTSQLQRLKAANVPNLANYRTMLPAEIVGAIAVEGRLEIKKQLALERDRLTRNGYQRVKKVETKPNGEKPAPSAAEGSPMAGSSPARGAGDGKPTIQEPYWKKYVTGAA